MKRVGNLYPQITDFANLLYASRQAQQGKRFRPNILEFNYNLERELLTLQRELISRTYQPGAYRTFHLIDIKSRLISAAPYRDRVVHHALCNIIVPTKGLPIGNLTSQFLANVMLNPFDHFVKERLNVDRYLRYVDDFALFSDDRHFLAYARLEIEDFLTQMRLKIHPIKSQLSTTKIGANFLGFRIFPDRIRVKNTNLHRARGRLNRLRSNYINGKIKWSQVERSLNSWNAHLKHGDTWRLS